MASVSMDDKLRARAVAAAALRQAERANVRLPDDLLVWKLAEPYDQDSAEADVLERQEGSTADLAEVLEAATSAGERQVKGLHVTPRWLADDLVGRAFDSLLPEPAREGPPVRRGPGAASTSAGLTVCDPACGGGAFLLAAARALHERGLPRRDVVEQCLWGADIDAVGLATAEAALAAWAGSKPPPGRLVVGDALTAGAALWTERPAQGFDAIVGNPPFLSQLASATVRSEAAREAVRRRFGSAVRPYTDTAWLFLLAGSELARTGGRVALLQPVSIVAARDAAAIREELGRRAMLRELWVEDGRIFAASVRVCCPVLELRQEQATETLPDPELRSLWADRLADAIGVPRVVVAATPTLGDRADVGAGFRGEYYGLVPLVREAVDGEVADAVLSGESNDRRFPERSQEPVEDGRTIRPLVTAGVLDWGRSAWGDRPVKFARRQWRHPVVDLTRAPERRPSTTPEGKAAAWLARTGMPKVIVANQTRVVEPVVDPQGSWVPSVPALAVMPYDPREVWLLAAALGSPTATAWLLRRAPGTALARHAMKITSGDLAALPLPVNRRAWEAAAQAFHDYAETGRESGAVAERCLDTYCREIARAYDAPEVVEAWWRDRRRDQRRRDQK